MGKPSAGEPTDYMGIAQTEGDQSRETAAFNANLNRYDTVTPYGSITWDRPTTEGGAWTQQTQFDPRISSMIDSSMGLGQSYMDTATQGMGRVSSALSGDIDLSGLPGLSGMSGARAVPGAVDDASRQRVEQAMYARLNPAMEGQEAAMRSRLANSGITVGSDAYKSEQDSAARARNDQMLGIIQAGGQEESRQVGLNSALQGQEFSQLLQSMQANNGARQQGLQEQAFLRSLPLNEINALRTGSQIGLPNFANQFAGSGGSGQGQFNASTPNTMQAAQLQGQQSAAQYGQDLGSYNAGMGAIASILAAYAASASDLRLKTSIRKLLNLNGVNIYTWVWNAIAHSIGVASQPTVGVIAQEHPQASRRWPDGYLRVDYSKIQ